VPPVHRDEVPGAAPASSNHRLLLATLISNAWRVGAHRGVPGSMRAMVELPSDLPVVERDAVRLVVQDLRGDVLLFWTHDLTMPELGYWWELPGGGINEGETYVETAVRELWEETGICIGPEQVGTPTWRRTASFRHRDTRRLQHEVVLVVALVVDGPGVDDRERLDYEKEDYVGFRWWPVADGPTTRPRTSSTPGCPRASGSASMCSTASDAIRGSCPGDDDPLIRTATLRLLRDDMDSLYPGRAPAQRRKTARRVGSGPRARPAGPVEATRSPDGPAGSVPAPVARANVRASSTCRPPSRPARPVRPARPAAGRSR